MCLFRVDKDEEQRPYRPARLYETREYSPRHVSALYTSTSSTAYSRLPSSALRRQYSPEYRRLPTLDPSPAVYRTSIHTLPSDDYRPRAAWVVRDGRIQREIANQRERYEIVEPPSRYRSRRH